MGGAIVGGIAEDQPPKFKAYVVEEKISSYTYQGEIMVGAELPATGVTFYEVPAEYGVTESKYDHDRTRACRTQVPEDRADHRGEISLMDR